jgi:hypothetical protein
MCYLKFCYLVLVRLDDLLAIFHYTSLMLTRKIHPQGLELMSLSLKNLIISVLS